MRPVRLKFDKDALRNGRIKLAEKDAVDYGDETSSKIRISMFVEIDTVLPFKKLAKKRKGKYQALMSEVLRDSIAHESAQGAKNL